MADTNQNAKLFAELFGKNTNIVVGSIGSQTAAGTIAQIQTANGAIAANTLRDMKPGVVLLFQASNGLWYCVNADQKATEVISSDTIYKRKTSPVSRPLSPGKIKVLYYLHENGRINFYIGGDRAEPTKIFDIPALMVEGQNEYLPNIYGFINNTGQGLDDWIVQIKYAYTALRWTKELGPRFKKELPSDVKSPIRAEFGLPATLTLLADYAFSETRVEKAGPIFGGYPTINDPTILDKYPRHHAVTVTSRKKWELVGEAAAAISPVGYGFWNAANDFLMPLCVNDAIEDPFPARAISSIGATNLELFTETNTKDILARSFGRLTYTVQSMFGTGIYPYKTEYYDMPPEFFSAAIEDYRPFVKLVYDLFPETPDTGNTVEFFLSDGYYASIFALPSTNFAHLVRVYPPYPPAPQPGDAIVDGVVLVEEFSLTYRDRMQVSYAPAFPSFLTGEIVGSNNFPPLPLLLPNSGGFYYGGFQFFDSRSNSSFLPREDLTIVGSGQTAGVSVYKSSSLEIKTGRWDISFENKANWEEYIYPGETVSRYRLEPSSIKGNSKIESPVAILPGVFVAGFKYDYTHGSQDGTSKRRNAISSLTKLLWVNDALTCAIASKIEEQEKVIDGLGVFKYLPKPLLIRDERKYDDSLIATYKDLSFKGVYGGSYRPWPFAMPIRARSFPAGLTGPLETGALGGSLFGGDDKRFQEDYKDAVPEWIKPLTFNAITAGNYGQASITQVLVEGGGYIATKYLPPPVPTPLLQETKTLQLYKKADGGVGAPVTLTQDGEGFALFDPKNAESFRPFVSFIGSTLYFVDFITQNTAQLTTGGYDPAKKYTVGDRVAGTAELEDIEISFDWIDTTGIPVSSPPTSKQKAYRGGSFECIVSNTGIAPNSPEGASSWRAIESRDVTKLNTEISVSSYVVAGNQVSKAQTVKTIIFPLINLATKRSIVSIQIAEDYSSATYTQQKDQHFILSASYHP